MTAGETPTSLLLDSNVLIDLTKLGVLDLVARSAGFDVCVVDEVAVEILRPSQRAMLDDAVAARLIRRVSLDTLDAQEAYSRLGNELDSGEAACVAYAAEHGCPIASDEADRRFLRTVESWLGPGQIIRLEDLLAACIQRGSLTLAGLDGVLAALAATAKTKRERDDVEHVNRVLTRVRRVLARDAAPER